MTTWRLMDGASGRPGTGSSGTQPPETAESYSGAVILGLTFVVTEGARWLEGYWWWVASGQDTSAQVFALWQPYEGDLSAALVPGGTVTSGTLSAGWNYVPLGEPLLLAPGGPYIAATGYTAALGFPLTNSQLGSGDPYQDGITNGPLTALPSTAALGFGRANMEYSFDSADPTGTCPSTSYQDSLYWLDVQVTDTAPDGASYRLWPSLPAAWNGNAGDTGNTLGVEFALSGSCALDRIWHYSPSGSAELPSRCAIFDATTQDEISGTDSQSPAWLLPGGASASAGAGWVYCDYSAAGVTLDAGTYKVATFLTDAVTWFSYSPGYWSADSDLDFGNGGIAAGLLSAPDLAHATSPGQATYNAGEWAFPGTYNDGQDGENHWVDVEVTPAAGTDPGLLLSVFP